MDYDNAVRILAPYKDINTAIAYMGADRNYNALEILKREPSSPEVNYMLAILYSRTGDEQAAVQKYMQACKQNPSFVHRGNLDPEISVLISMYGLNQEPEDDLFL